MCSPTRLKPHVGIFTCPWILRCLKASLSIWGWRGFPTGRIRNEGCSRDVICLAEMHRLFPCLRHSFCWLQTVWASRPKCAKFWFQFIFWKSLSCKMGTQQKTLKICKVSILIYTQLNVIHIFVGEISWICPLPRFPKALRAGTPMCFSCQLEFLPSSLLRLH